VFDGSVGDLAEKMRILSCDEMLRRKISRPFAVIGAPLGEFYQQKPPASWIQSAGPAELPGLLVCVLVDDPQPLAQTLETLRAGAPVDTRVVLLHAALADPAGKEGRRGVATWFLGGLYTPTDADGTPLNPADIRTAGALLVIKSGDELTGEYLRRGLAMLGRQPQIAFVAGWIQSLSQKRSHLDTTPFDAVAEIAPFLRDTPFSRALMRTEPGKLLIDLFDPRAGRLGELGYLWRINTGDACGLVIPKVMLTRSDPPEPIIDQQTLDYLFLQDLSPVRKLRLARFPLSLADRAQTLRQFSLEWNISHPVVFDLNRIQSRLAASRLSQWMAHAPGLKKALRRMVEITFSSVARLMALSRKH
jgi:hypothetical protein